MRLKRNLGANFAILVTLALPWLTPSALAPPAAPSAVASQGAPPPAEPPEPPIPVEVAGITFASRPRAVYLPLAEVKERFGVAVRWDPKTRAVYVDEGKIARQKIRRLLSGTRLVDVAALQLTGFTYRWDAAERAGRLESESECFLIRDAPKRVVINRSAQRMHAWQGEQLVFATHISTGRRGFETPRGAFIAGPVKSPMLISRKYGNAPMPWSVQVHGNVCIHGSASVPARPASHGCIRVPLSGQNPARWFYDWVSLGTPITIADRWPKQGREAAAPRLRKTTPKTPERPTAGEAVAPPAAEPAPPLKPPPP